MSQHPIEGLMDTAIEALKMVMSTPLSETRFKRETEHTLYRYPESALDLLPAEVNSQKTDRKSKILPITHKPAITRSCPLPEEALRESASVRWHL